MNLLDVFLIVLLAAVFAWALYIIRSNRKNGRSCHSCGGDCCSCRKQNDDQVRKH